MSFQRYTSRAMPAFKLMATENEYHHRNEMLTKEIRKLRGEVGVMARRYSQARNEIKQLIAKVKLQPAPIIPNQIEKEKEKESEEEVSEGEGTEMEEMGSEEKERKEPQTVRGPNPRKPTLPSPPPPPPPPTPEHSIALEKALKYAGKKGEKSTTVSQPNTVVCAADKTPPATLPNVTKTEIEKAGEKAMERHNKWERAAKGYFNEAPEGRISYGRYIGESCLTDYCKVIGQWSIDHNRIELTKFDFWGFETKLTRGRNLEKIGEAWIELAEWVKEEKIRNVVYRE